MHGLAHAWRGRPDRPSWSPATSGLVYERVVDGLLLRAGADLVLANSAVDAHGSATCSPLLDADPDSVVARVVAVPRRAPYDPTAAGRNRPFTVTFVTQPGVPELATNAGTRWPRSSTTPKPPRAQVMVKLRGRPASAPLTSSRTTSRPCAGRRWPDNVELGLRLDGRCARPDRSVRDRELHCGHRGHAPRYPDRDPHRLRHPGVAGQPGVPRLRRFTSWPALHAGEVPETDPGWAARQRVRDAGPVWRAAARTVADCRGRPPRPRCGRGGPPTRPATCRPCWPHGVDVFGVPLVGAPPAVGAAVLGRSRALRSARPARLPGRRAKPGTADQTMGAAMSACDGRGRRHPRPRWVQRHAGQEPGSGRWRAAGRARGPRGPRRRLVQR